MYINSIKAAAVVLRLPVSERGFVNNIVEWLAPTQLSSFVFQKLPTKILHLLIICSSPSYVIMGRWGIAMLGFRVNM